MTQWAEVRHLHLVEDVPKKGDRPAVEAGRQDSATGQQPADPAGAGVAAPGRAAWTRGGSGSRSGCARSQSDREADSRLLLPLTGPDPARMVRRCVAGLREPAAPKEAFLHRSVRAATTMEVDFGESWVDIAGVPCKVKYLVATPPFANADFAKAYAVERLESLLDGHRVGVPLLQGVVDRVVLDNTSLAVKAVLPGRGRIETEAFEVFRWRVSVPG